MEKEPEIEVSDLSHVISSGGKRLSVEINRIRNTMEWSLEIVDEVGNSTVWDDTFDSDSAAIAEAKKAILEETAAAFVGPADGKSNGKWR